MTTYYVDVAVGNDVNAGTSEGAGNAWASIGKALDTVVAGNTVYVKASGDYTAQHGASGAIGEFKTGAAVADFILFEGYTTTPGDGTFACVTLDAGPNTLANCLKYPATDMYLYYAFRFFRFTGASGDGVDALGATYGRSIGFYSCRFDNNGGSGLGGSYYYTLNLCQFDNNSSYGAIGTYIIVSNCVAFSNGDAGIRIS